MMHWNSPVQQRADGLDLLGVRQTIILNRTADVADQAEHGNIQIIDEGFDLLLLPPAVLQQTVHVFTRSPCLKGSRDAEPEIDQIVLTAVELKFDKPAAWMWRSLSSRRWI